MFIFVEFFVWVLGTNTMKFLCRDSFVYSKIRREIKGGEGVSRGYEGRG